MGRIRSRIKTKIQSKSPKAQAPKGKIASIKEKVSGSVSRAKKGSVSRRIRKRRNKG